MLDHLVVATPDLAATVADFAERTGVEPVPGGSHTGRGTANALVGFGPDSYLEIIGPDLHQPEPSRPRPFDIDHLVGARLVTWAARSPDLDVTVARSVHAGYDPGPVESMSRAAPGGEQLTWRLTPSRGLVPFLIDWGTTAHPGSRGLPRVVLTAFALLHPDPPEVQSALDAMGIAMLVEQGPVPALAAIVETPKGSLAL